MIGPDHLSFSSVNKYVQCAKSWAAQYLDGHRSRPGTALIKGKSVDRVATVNWDQKRKSGKDIDIEYGKEMAEQFFRNEVDRAGGRDEIDWKREAWNKALESTIKLAAAHLAVHAPLFTPDATQVEVRRPIEGSSRYFIGFLDAAHFEEEPDVIDVKTGTRKLSQNDADIDGQASAYAFALNRPIDFTFLRVIDTGHGPVRAERVDTQRGEQGIALYEETVQHVNRGIDAGVFPASPGFHCAWCPIRGKCVEALTN